MHVHQPYLGSVHHADAPSPGVAVSHETTADLNSGKVDDIGTASDECAVITVNLHLQSSAIVNILRSPVQSPVAVIVTVHWVKFGKALQKSGSDLAVEKRRYSNGDEKNDGDEGEQSRLMIRRHMCSSISQVGGYAGNIITARRN